MIEVKGNLWTYSPVDVRIITTNGFVKKNGEAVMGRGCALEAKQLFPEIAKTLGDHITKQGNIPAILMTVEGEFETYQLVSMPVKHTWHEAADPLLIETSAKILRAWADLNDWDTIVLPRPGCGNGQLRWEDVRPVLEPILDDRFHVISF